MALSHSLSYDIGFFKTQALFLIDDLQDKSEDESCHAETGQHDQGSRIVKLCGVCDARVRLVENLSDKQREEPETYVLNPEDEGIGRPDYLCIDQLRHAGPQGSRDKREGRAQYENRRVGDDDSANGISLEGRKHEGERL